MRNCARRLYHGDNSSISAASTTKGTLTYKGVYEVTTPAGTFESVLLKTDLQTHVGPAQVEDTQYTFFAPALGITA